MNPHPEVTVYPQLIQQLLDLKAQRQYEEIVKLLTLWIQWWPSAGLIHTQPVDTPESPVHKHYGRADIYFELGRALRSLGRYHESIAAYEHAMKEHDGDRAFNTNSLSLALHCEMGEVYRFVTDYTSSVRSLSNGITQLYGLPPGKWHIEMFNALGVTYTHIGELVQAQKHLETALDTAKEIGDRHRSISVLGNLGVLAGHRAEMKEALQFTEEVYALAKEVGDVRFQCTACINKAHVLIKDEQLDLAQEICNEACELASTAGSKSLESRAYFQLAMSIGLQDQFDLAVRVAHQAMALAGEEDIELQCYGEGLLSELHERAGASEVALMHKEKYRSVQIELVKRQLDKGIVALSFQRELESAALRQRALSEQADLHGARIQSYAKQVARKNELLQALASKIEALEAQSAIALPELRPLRNQIAQNLSRNEERETFDTYFELHGPPIMSRLHQSFPSLSKAELRIASLVYIGLTSSEIGYALNVSPRTVEVHRLNIRKKIAVPEMEELANTLRNAIDKAGSSYGREA